MDISDKILYYAGIVGIILALVGIAIALLGLITDAYILIGKCLIGLAISTSCFVRGRKAKREAQVRELQEWLDHMAEPMSDQEEDKPPKA